MLDLLTPTILIGLAGSCFVLGYLMINQMMLRLLVLTGSLFYIAYYATAAETPLWGAIYMSLAMVTANLIGIATLAARRARISLPRAHADIYDQFDVLTPGDFRLVMHYADRYIMPSDHEITTEGAPIDGLYFVLSGQVRVSKRGVTFPLPDGLFVGEVAYLLDRPSVATTHLSKGSEILRWDLDLLRQKARRNPRLKLAIDAMLSRDLAGKVAEAVAQHSAPFAQAATPARA